MMSEPTLKHKFLNVDSLSRKVLEVENLFLKAFYIIDSSYMDVKSKGYTSGSKKT